MLHQVVLLLATGLTGLAVDSMSMGDPGTHKNATGSYQFQGPWYAYETVSHICGNLNILNSICKFTVRETSLLSHSPLSWTNWFTMFSWLMLSPAPAKNTTPCPAMPSPSIPGISSLPIPAPCSTKRPNLVISDLRFWIVSRALCSFSWEASRSRLLQKTNLWVATSHSTRWHTSTGIVGLNHKT